MFHVERHSRNMLIIIIIKDVNYTCSRDVKQTYEWLFQKALEYGLHL